MTSTIDLELHEAGVRVRHKRSSWLMQVIGALLWPFGRRAWFLDRTWTTVGSRTIWAPASVDLAHLWRVRDIVRHEMVHVRQWKRYPVVGQLAYLLVLPVGLAYFRWVFEREAYLVQIRAKTMTAEQVVKTLGSLSYFWSWPRPWMRKWFAKAVQK